MGEKDKTKVIWEQGKFTYTTTNYHKPYFSDIYSRFVDRLVDIVDFFFFFCLKLLDNMHLILQMFSYLLGLEKNQYSLTRIQDRGGGGG